MQDAVSHVAGSHGAHIGKLRVGEHLVVVAVVGVFHAHGRLYVETAALFLHSDDDGMPLQPHEILGQAGDACREADTWIGGISHAKELTAEAVITVVVRHDDFSAVDGDTDDIAQCESCLRHIRFGEIEHGSAKLIIRCDFAFEHRPIDRRVIA